MSESPRYGISDALLPLLDVTLLLLGLFIIIFQVEVALSKAKAPPVPDASSLLGNVAVVRIDSNARILFRGVEGEMHVPDVDTLQRDYLRSLRRSDPDAIVLTALDDPWCDDSNATYKKCKTAIRRERLRQARIY